MRTAVVWKYGIDIGKIITTTRSVATNGRETVTRRIGFDIPKLLTDANVEHGEGWFFLCLSCGARRSAYAVASNSQSFADLSPSVVHILRGLCHKSASYRYYRQTCSKCGRTSPGATLNVPDPFSISSETMPLSLETTRASDFENREGFPPAAIALRTELGLKNLGYSSEYVRTADHDDICPKLFHGSKLIERKVEFSQLKRTL